MTNSKGKHKAQQMIKNILEITDEEYLYQNIHRPIEETFEKFEFDREIPLSHEQFIHTVSELLRQIYRYSFSPQQIMTASQARAEALAILEEGYQSYQNARDHGYDAAFSDASDTQDNGLEFVLSQLVELIITRARYRHIEWIYATRLEMIDWQTKCLMAEIMLDRWKPFLPQSILSCSPSQLADYLSDLIDVILSSDRIVRRSASTYL